MELHYKIAGNYAADAHLIGSNSVKIGVELYGGYLRRKNLILESRRPENLPYWIIPDTKGILKGFLHSCRRFEYCKDVIVLVSEETPTGYINHLEERNYDYYVLGKKHVNLGRALNLLSEKYG